MSRLVTVTISFNTTDDTSDETILAFVAKLEDEVGKASYDLDDITHEIEGDYEDEDSCEHSWALIRSNAEGDSLYRCRICKQEYVS